MPGLIETVLRINNVLGDLETFDPAALQDLLANQELTLLDAADAVGAIDVLDTEQEQQQMRDFLERIPPACSAAALAAVRSAIGRGLRVQLTWQPAAAFEVRVWDVSEAVGDDQYQGMVNVFVRSPDPEAPA